MTIDTTSQEFFESKYRQNPDFWHFGSNPYELKRYNTMLEALQGKRYSRAFEPGCSVGVFTERLAPLCDRVEAIDISPTAVAHARLRCGNLANVNVQRGTLPGDIPEGAFDLIVFSEIGYYFTAEKLGELGRALAGKLRPTGTFLATHWLGHSADHLLSGEQVHAVLKQLAGWNLEHSERHPGFLLDRWTCL